MKNRSTLVLLIRSHGKRTITRLVERGCTTDVTCTGQCDMSVRTYHDSSLWRSLRERNGFVGSWSYQPLTVTSTGKGLSINDVNLFRTCLYSYFGGVVRLLFTLVGTDADDVCRGRL